MTSHRLGFAAALLFALPLSVAAGSLSSFFRTAPAMNHIDYKSLEFTCSREEDHVPTPTPEAEALFQRARDAHNRATAGERLDKALMQQAMEDYRRAAEAGHWKAVRNLAYLHMQGLEDESGGKPFLRADSDKTLPYVRKLIDMKVATGYALMASFAAEGWGVRQDDKAAKIYQRRAADLGHVPSQQHLGRVFLLNFNKLPPKERDQIVEVGRKMLACAVRQGDREAASDLASEYEVIEKNYPYALFYYHQGAKMGDATCLYVLEKWFTEGQYGYARDPKRAKLYRAYNDRTDKPGAGRFPEIDKEIPLPPPPKGGAYPPPEAGWPSQWTKPVQKQSDNAEPISAVSTTIATAVVPAAAVPPTEAMPAQSHKPAKAALGTRLGSGETCPQTGTWVCETSHGGIRRVFVEGETFIGVRVAAKPGLLQKLKGEPATEVADTTWTLAELPEDYA